MISFRNVRKNTSTRFASAVYLKHYVQYRNELRPFILRCTALKDVPRLGMSGM